MIRAIHILCTHRVGWGSGVTLRTGSHGGGGEQMHLSRHKVF